MQQQMLEISNERKKERENLLKGDLFYLILSIKSPMRIFKIEINNDNYKHM